MTPHRRPTLAHFRIAALVAGVLSIGTLYVTRLANGATPSAMPVSGIAPYHLTTHPTRRFTATYTATMSGPKLKAVTWLSYFPIAPDLPNQSGMTTTFSSPDAPRASAISLTEASDLKRGVLQLKFPVASPQTPSDIRLTATISGTLSARDLVSGAPTTPAPPLTASESARALETSATIDYEAPAFQRWLDQRGLRRKATENDVDFARRALRGVADNWDYHYDSAQNRSVSHLITARTTDCGGASCAFVSILRANHIPARMLVGRWAITADSSHPNEVGQCHVKAEFFAYGIGWVPVEASGAISSKNIPATFGHDDGKHIALHIDPDMILDSVHWGPSPNTWMQGAPIWATGSGNFDGFTNNEGWKVQ